MSKIIVEVIYVDGKINKFTFDTASQVKAFKVGMTEAFTHALSYRVKVHSEKDWYPNELPTTKKDSKDRA